jgi:signal transduction histidine kinase
MPKQSLYSSKTLPYVVLLWCLFGLAGYFGISSFDDSAEGVIALPITPGETAGFYLPTGELSFEQIAQADSAERLFIPYLDSISPIVTTDRIHLWLRLPLTNPSAEGKEYTLQLNYPWIHLVNFYATDPAGNWQIETRGQAPQIRNVRLPRAAPAFQFTLAAGESRVFYLQMRDAIWLDPSITLWDNSPRYEATFDSRQQFFYVYMGLIVGLFFANFCVYLAFNYADLRYYLFYLGGTLLLHLVNMNYGVSELHAFFHAQHILSDRNFSYLLYSGLLVLHGGLLLLFAVEFLELAKAAPRLFRWMQSIILVLMVASPLIAFGPAQIFGTMLPNVVAVSWITANLLVVLLATYGLYRRIHQAHYLLAAVLLLLIVSWRFNHAIFTNSPVSAEILKQWLFASSLEMMVLVFGLVDRFMSVNRDRELARTEAIKAMAARVELQETFSLALNQTVAERTEALRTADQQKDRLLAFLAHDMRTPLSSLVSLSSMLGRMPADLSKQNIKRYATEIEASARAVTELMENLLSWGQLQSGQLRMNKQEFLVDDLYDAAHRILKTQANLRQIEIHFQSAQDVYCDCDFTSIVAVLRNLMSNAVKFSADGGEVLVSAHEASDCVVFKVQNFGSDVSTKSIEAINSGAIPEQTVGFDGETGAGLGLQICFDLLELHSSRLSACVIESAQGINGIAVSFALQQTASETPRSLSTTRP